MTALIAAVATVLGTLGGVFLGSYLQGRSRRDEWLRQDRQRWLEGRRSQYASFVHTMDAALAALVDGMAGNTDDMEKGASALWREFAELKLIAESDSVVRIAGEYVKLFEDVGGCWAEMQLMIKEPEKYGDTLKVDALEGIKSYLDGFTQLSDTSARFVSKARLELGLTELDPRPIEHPARAAEAYSKRKFERITEEMRMAFQSTR